MIKRTKSRYVFLLVVFTIVIAAAGACGSPDQTDTTTPTVTTSSQVRFSADIQPLFNSRCVACHQGVGDAGLSLEPGKAHASLVNVASTQSPLVRVTPGNPEQSYLLHKLNGTQLQVGGTGSRMPFGSSALSASQIDLVRNWISQGAQNN
ncbi:MAG: hypothetical protein JW954_02310 [Dehalococcoidaceae bacterium]|nr:hypothetical protein [Dehalococcoidaceae bacterium]